LRNFVAGNRCLTAVEMGPVDIQDFDDYSEDDLQEMLDSLEGELKELDKEHKGNRQKKFLAKKALKNCQKGYISCTMSRRTSNESLSLGSQEKIMDRDNLMDVDVKKQLFVDTTKHEEELTQLAQGMSQELLACSKCFSIEALRDAIELAEQIPLECDAFAAETGLSKEVVRAKLHVNDEALAEAWRRLSWLEAEKSRQMETTTLLDDSPGPARQQLSNNEQEKSVRPHLDSGQPEATQCRTPRCSSVYSFKTARESLEEPSSRSTSPSSENRAGRDLKDVPNNGCQQEAVNSKFATDISDTSPGNTSTSADSPIPRAVAKGKGKGRGCAPKLPPPSAKHSVPKPSSPPLPMSGLVSLYWKVSKEPEDVNKLDNTFLETLLTTCPCEEDTQDIDSLQELVPSRPATIFNPCEESNEVPHVILEHYMSRNVTTTAWRPQHESCPVDSDVHTRQKTLIQKKYLEMLGITVRKYLMEHKGETIDDAIISIKRSVLRCDFDVVRLEVLSVIRSALRQHDRDGQPVCTYVRSHGEESLDTLAAPQYHRLVYELSKIPQIDERLECMLFHVPFHETLQSCKCNLETVKQALEMLSSRKELARRFFITTHRLGQSLNRDATAPKALNGFQLSTLEKLSKTKCAKYPSLSLLHFILALMSREDASSFFDDEDIKLLKQASTLGTDRVYSECIDLLQCIYGVQQICKDGSYRCLSTGQEVKMEKRRKSKVPLSSEREPVEDTDDHFHEVMKHFVEDNVEAAEDLAEHALDVILMYKELAVYFDDFNSVYPPPKCEDMPHQSNESDKKKDLITVFYNFAAEIKKHRGEDLNVRGIIASANSQNNEGKAGIPKAQSLPEVSMECIDSDVPRKENSAPISRSLTASLDAAQD